MSFLFRVSHQFSLMLLPLSPDIPKPLPHGHSPYAAPPVIPRISPPLDLLLIRLMSCTRFLLFSAPYIWPYIISAYLSFFSYPNICPLYYTLISYPNDNPIFLFAALMLYRIPYTNQYPSYSSILYSHVCPLYTTHMPYIFYHYRSSTG